MILAIPGAYCPMGCGQTLVLQETGIWCTGGDRPCPDPGAVQKILSSPETDDIVVFGVDSFTVLHPLKERLGDLFSCQVHVLCAALEGPPDGKNGRYRARITGYGLELEEVPEG